jgi:hypothetical protein
LYWFEVVSPHTSEVILETFKAYSKSPNCKAVPAIKSQPSHGTKILYVGKVKTQFWGRLITHLGFFKTQRTQGLQLFHWGKELGLQLRVHLYEFEDAMSSLMPIRKWNGCRVETVAWQT